MAQLLPIVEGDGDLQAVPVLIRRVLAEHQRFDVQILPAQKRGEWPKVKREFERFFLSARIEDAPILWVLDFDSDDYADPLEEANWLRSEAQRLDPRGAIDVAFVIKEFESLFLCDRACLESAFPEFSQKSVMPQNPETIRDAKGWISACLPKGRAYKPTADQARMAAIVDIEQLRAHSPSFKRFEDAILWLTAE